ncbi:MAG: hypothetical protein CM15mP53_01960 [Ectothiorhodospiraceae bacterium]|nr:MAG: hypothetical protein CM15mP53_01960 [Ectothiorhodospiraceae bacterium]
MKEKERQCIISPYCIFRKGVEKIYLYPYEYCKKGAYKGSARAMNNLAYMYMRGLGTKRIICQRTHGQKLLLKWI